MRAPGEDDVGAGAAAGERDQLEAALKPLLDHAADELEPEAGDGVGRDRAAVVDVQPRLLAVRQPYGDRRCSVLERVRDQLVRNQSKLLRSRRVEVRISQTEITAVVLDTGELACRHRRVFAGGLTLTDPAHQTRLERQREKRRQRHQVEVEIRPLSRYDALIPA